MKALRRLPALLASCLLAIVAIPLVRADAPTTIDWTGEGETPSATDGGNWQAPGEPPITPYSPTGYENLRFGEIPTSVTNIYIPVMLNEETEEPMPLPLYNLSFSNIATEGFNFSFSGNSPLDSALYLQGNVDLAANGTAHVQNSMALLLSLTNHSVSIGDGSSLVVDAPVFEYGEDYYSSASVEKWGSGNLVLKSADNDYSGGTTVYEGTLTLGQSSVIESEGDYYEIISGPVGTGTLKFETNGTSPTLALADDGSYTLHNTIDLGCFNGSVNFDTGSGSLSLVGYISGWAGITKQGSGTLTLHNGYNEFSGGVTVKAGTLLLGASSQEAEIEMFSEGDDEEISYASGPVGTGTLKMEAGTTLGLADDDSYLLHNDIDLGCFDGTVTINTGAGDLTLVGHIFGTAGINKMGSGTLTLEEENEMQGDFYVSAGTVEVNNDWALGYGALEFGTSSGSTVNFNSDYPEIGGLEGSSATDTINLNGHEGMGAGLTIHQEENSTFAGVIAGNGYVDLYGCGNLTLSGQSTFTGSLYIAPYATLTLGGSSHTTNGTEVDSSPIGTGALLMDDESTLSASGHGITLLNDIALDGGIGSTSNFFIPGGSDLTIGNGTLGTIYGDGRLNKTGLGTLTLMTANDYHGGTSIDGGVLAVGDIGALGTGTVTIAGGALKLTNGVTNISNTLDFSQGGGGTLTGSWTFTTLQTFGAGVTLAPGNSPGTMTFAAGYAPTGGVTTEFEFASAFGTAGTDWDVISVTGALDLASISAGNRYNLELVSLDGNNTQGAPINGLVATSWVIFKTTGGVTLPGGVLAADIDTLFNIDASKFHGGGIFDLMISGNDIVLNFTPVPEPSTYALMALGTALTGLAAWRKRRRA